MKWISHGWDCYESQLILEAEIVTGKSGVKRDFTGMALEKE